MTGEVLGSEVVIEEVLEVVAGDFLEVGGFCREGALSEVQSQLMASKGGALPFIPFMNHDLQFELLTLSSKALASTISMCNQ